LSALSFETTLAFLGARVEQVQMRFLRLAAANDSHIPPTPNNTPILKKLHITARKETTHHMRDGDVVLYRRPYSSFWQVRYKLFSKRWHCVSTKQRRLDWAMRVAGEMYDRARFKEEEGLPQTSRRFDAVAKTAIRQMELDIERGIKPMTNKDYIRAINNYLLPFFGKRMLNNINGEVVREYEQWRNEKMKRVPISSTLATHSSAFNRIVEVAIEQGWLSDKVPVARLSRKGRKGTARPAFTKAEVEALLAFLPKWSDSGKTAKAREMRLLLRDYIEILLATGMRCGKESMNMLWKHIEWHTDKDVRYLRIWVSGKTGGRWLIAKHIAADAFSRLALRQSIGAELDEAIASKRNEKVFRLSNGLQPASLHTTFIWLMKDCGLAKDAITDKPRTLYSLRHTYATLSLMDGQMDVHTLAKQMGTSIAMLEQHYSKMTATMAAARLA
jgi:integrase